MMDGTNLNVLQTSRQMLRAFGGLNEGYGCSEAEFSGEMNFSSRGYPALQTRKMRRNVRTVQGVNGMYHLNGLLIAGIHPGRRSTYRCGGAGERADR